MKEMQRLQPLIQELKEKHGDDRERFNQEMMQLYRTHKVNPLGGCLPILVQIPVFIALYQALLNSVELRQAPFFAWIRDLSAPDHTYITPILMTASMFAQQKMSPPMADPAQQKVMMFMPLIFGFMFLNFPSGLVLYWLVNNILSIAQQYWINRQHG
jgi:YidC/Oxa1 family membrane protein insertase